ncbi:MAG: hypothetical protein JXB00_18040 [Bacteroidales bacterium]|nr:hypothetical protein [Bacteroidales bacterium]
MEQISIESTKNIVETTAIVIAGIWVLWRFVLVRERYPKIQFDLDDKVLGKSDNKIMLELIAIIENKGLVRHYIHDFRFDLLYLSSKEPVTEGNQHINFQIKLPKLIDKRLWLPILEEKGEYTFIDAGVRQLYTYITSVPEDSLLVSIHSKFDYRDIKSAYHISQRTFKVLVSEQYAPHLA